MVMNDWKNRVTDGRLNGAVYVYYSPTTYYYYYASAGRRRWTEVMRGKISYGEKGLMPTPPNDWQVRKRNDDERLKRI